MQPDPNEPVNDWPVPTGEPVREVWYSLVSPRDASVAFWYRYTLLSTTSGYQEGRLWAALTDPADSAASTFVSRSVPLSAIRAGRDPFELVIDDAVLTSSGATGDIEAVSWDLRYEPDTYAFTPLRSQRLTNLLSRAIGTGKHWSRNESVFMTGEVTVGDRTIDFEDAPGHQGHTVSSLSPPEDWTWVQCNDFAEDESAVLEALRLDDKLSLCLRVGGEVYPLNRLKHVLSRSPSANELVRDEVVRRRWHYPEPEPGRPAREAGTERRLSLRRRVDTLERERDAIGVGVAGAVPVRTANLEVEMVPLIGVPEDRSGDGLGVPEERPSSGTADQTDPGRAGDARQESPAGQPSLVITIAHQPPPLLPLPFSPPDSSKGLESSHGAARNSRSNVAESDVV